MPLRGMPLAPVRLVRPAMTAIFPLRGRPLAMTIRITPVSWVMSATGIMSATWVMSTTGIMGIVGTVVVWITFMRPSPCIVWDGFRLAQHGDRW